MNPNLMEMKLRAFSTKVNPPHLHAGSTPAPGHVLVWKHFAVASHSMLDCIFGLTLQPCASVCGVLCRCFYTSACAVLLTQVHSVATTVAYKQDDATEAVAVDQAS